MGAALAPPQAQIADSASTGSKLSDEEEELLYCMIVYDGPADQFDCGPDALNNSWVFVGRITALRPMGDHNTEIVIVPEEVFYGNPPHPTVVVTSHANCWRKPAVGARWLFSVEKQRNPDESPDYWLDSSGPVDEMASRIETLRRLNNIGDFGIPRGSARKSYLSDEFIPNARDCPARIGQRIIQHDRRLGRIL